MLILWYEHVILRLSASWLQTGCPATLTTAPPRPPICPAACRPCPRLGSRPRPRYTSRRWRPAARTLGPIRGVPVYLHDGDVLGGDAVPRQHLLRLPAVGAPHLGHHEHGLAGDTLINGLHHICIHSYFHIVNSIEAESRIENLVSWSHNRGRIHVQN